MRALKVIVGLMVAVVLIVLGVGLFLPKEFSVERTIEIEAPPERVFDQVNSLRNWDAWSPWLARDPTITNRYSGPEAGVGSKVEWTSEAYGEGSQTITLSERPSRIETRFDFGEMGQPIARWSFEPQGEGVLVTWGLHGKTTGPLGGYIAPKMDDWVGADYEEGLARLKVVAEGMDSSRAPNDEAGAPARMDRGGMGGGTSVR